MTIVEEKENRCLVQKVKRKKDALDSTRSESEESELSSNDEIINVECDFYDFREIDLLGLQTLLRQNFHGDIKKQYYTELASLIISQPYLGSAAKTDDIDSDPVAFMTLIDIKKYINKNQALKALITHLFSKVPHHLQSEAWFSKKTGEFKNMGLLLNERVMNVPPSIASPLLMMLLEEIETVKSEKQLLLDIESVIYVSKVYATKIAWGARRKNKNARKSKKNKKNPDIVSSHEDEGSVFFVQSEDAILEKYATSVFEYTCNPKNSQEYVDSSGAAVNTLGARMLRKVFIIPLESLQKIKIEMCESYHDR